jgi:hypothetical protein
MVQVMVHFLCTIWYKCWFMVDAIGVFDMVHG